MDPNVAGSSPVDRPSFFMTLFEAILLGIIQGLTEFFPVSSSGHLELGQHFLGLTQLDQYIFFDLVCHLGTLLALFCVFLPQIQAALFDRTRFLQIVLATLPLFPLVLLMKPIKTFFDQPQYLGYCFLFTAFLLYCGTRKRSVVVSERPWRNSLFVGMFQAIAILPGVSRSGATISAGRLVGWPQQEAITFSFLLAIPAILGGVALETFHWMRAQSSPENVVSMSFFVYAAGFVTSFAVGYLSLRALIQLATNDKFHYFIWYCVAVGVFSLIYFN